MGGVQPRLGIVYEHPEWFEPLFRELDRRAVAYDRIDVSRHQFDPEATEIPWTLVFNRMSPSAYLRGHGQGIRYTLEFLRYLEGLGVDVVNGSGAFALEISKVAQQLLFKRLGLRSPRARVINHPAEAPAGAEGLEFPVIVKPNIGGSGAGIRQFVTPDALAQAATAQTISLGVDDTALVQEFLPARGGHIVRVEVLDGRFLYAIKVYPNPAMGFNLCPADICQPDAVVEGGAGSSAIASLSGDFCPVDLPKVALKVEGYTPPDGVIREVLAIAGAAGFDLGGVEYLVSDRDGEIYYYDVNVLSNFVTNAVEVVGFDPYEVLVNYLSARARLRTPRKDARLHPPTHRTRAGARA